MSMTDPIADMLTRIRNAVRIERPHVELPLSKLHVGDALHDAFELLSRRLVDGSRRRLDGVYGGDRNRWTAALAPFLSLSTPSGGAQSRSSLSTIASHRP